MTIRDEVLTIFRIEKKPLRPCEIIDSLPNILKKKYDEDSLQTILSRTLSELVGEGILVRDDVGHRKVYYHLSERKTREEIERATFSSIPYVPEGFRDVEFKKMLYQEIPEFDFLSFKEKIVALKQKFPKLKPAVIARIVGTTQQNAWKELSRARKEGLIP